MNRIDGFLFELLLVTTSKALVTSSDALVTTFLFLQGTKRPKTSEKKAGLDASIRKNNGHDLAIGCESTPSNKVRY